MRDTEVLRRRLWAQIGLPLATVALLGACGGQGQPKPVKQAKGDDAPSKGAGQEGQAKDASDEGPDKATRTTTNSATPGYVPPGRYEDIPEGEFDYFGPARDPFGEHSEEEGCPNGDWCGSPEDARKFAVQHIPDKLDCPQKIIANPTFANSINKDDAKWKGLSFHPMMQGRLVSTVTEEEREKGKQGVCCYHWFEYCSGRPLLDGEDMVVAELRAGSSWSCEASEVAAPAERPDSALPAALRARLGELWVQDALMEHAAIGAFERATLELMAMAAPPTLLAEIQAAAADEVEHATRCFGLAARFSGQQREPGPLASLEPRVRGLAGYEDQPDAPEVGRDWERLALDTFVEGCVGETIAALIAQRSQRHCQDPATLATQTAIADDEGRHAGLAWRTIRWILATSGSHRAAVLAALEQQAEAMADAAREACTPDALPAADPDAPLLARYGRCDRRTELLARRDAWDELILPTLSALAGEDPNAEGPEAWT